eukprot:SAG11_NODE_124_length_15798_cov_14.675776_11_plen_65_part_00
MQLRHYRLSFSLNGCALPVCSCAGQSYDQTQNLTLGFKCAKDMKDFLERVWPTIQLAGMRRTRR